ncbi:MAG TPA: lamin tail domain-containing protein [Archangium sp.]|uniref:lamin tail domain-containing protein n=1 Tax=Archangium sp. TaxID=1872627 RepID=UPI002E35067D|nr:lamin tail domain-containing protein [Archangium sp.]HEX5745976.1 lamin tail domain-containing protein [Archangium sp.]
MMHGPPGFARLVAWSVLLLGLSVGCGQGCGDPGTNPPAAREMPDADRSSVAVSRSAGVRANGEDAVDIQVTVRKADGTALAGRTVRVAVSGEGNAVTQPAGTTDDQGQASAKLVSTVAGVKTVTVSVEAEGGAVTLSSRPTVEFVRLPAAKLAFIVAPSSGTAGAALGAFEVVIQNAEGETVSDATGPVTVAIGSGPAAATLKGTATVAAVNGVARFTDLVIEKAARDYTLVASSGSLTGATSASFDVASASPASLTMSHPGGPVTAGVAQSVEVVVQDAFGNDAAGYTGTVRFTSEDGAATVPADYTFTAADAGRHPFTGILVTRAGSHRLTVTDTVTAAFTSFVDLTVVPAAVSALVFTDTLPDRSVREGFGVQVLLTDAFGNQVRTSTPDVTLSANKPGRVTGLGTVTPVEGVATFSGLSIAEEDTGYVLTASAPGVGSVPGTAFDIIDDVAPSKPELAQTGNSPRTLTVAWAAVGDDGMLGTPASYELRYSTSNIVTDLDFDRATAVAVAAPSPSDTTRSVTLSGLTSNTAYYVALKVTDNSGNTVRSDTLPVSTKNLTAAQLAFVEQPRSGKAGTVLAPITVEVRDADGVRVDTASVAVTLTVVGTSGFGPFTVTSDKGVATFTDVRIDEAREGYTLKATSSGLTEDDSTPFNITHSEATRLTLVGLAPTTIAGTDNTLTVAVQDVFNNSVEDYTGTVSFTSSDAAADKPSPYTFVAADKGLRRFDHVVLRTVGEQSLTVSAAGLPDATLRTEVGHSDASTLVLTGLPATVNAGDSSTLTLEVRDGFGNRATGYTGTVVLSATDSKATLASEYTFTATDKGLKTFPVTLVTAGAQSVTVQDKASPAINAKADTTVKWLAVSRLVLAAPASVEAGGPLALTVTAVDVHDNVVKDYTREVTFSVDADRASGPASYLFALADEGSRRFDFTLEKAVSTKITVTDTAGLSASHTVSVSHAPASELVLVAPSTPVDAGVAFTVDVTLKDAYGNVATGYTGTLGFTSSDPKLVPPASGALTSADAGHKVFSVTLKTAGEQSLTVKDLARTFLTATAPSLVVNPGPARKLVFRDQPTGGKVRTALAAVTVAVTDAFDNVLDVDAPDITVGLVGGNPAAVLGGGSLSVKPVKGIATFSGLTVDQQGTGFQLEAMGGLLDAARSNTFTLVDDIAPGAVALSVTGKTSIQVELKWTAVGDDGLVGTASSHELLYATVPVETAPAGSVSSVSLDDPQPPGTEESVLVAGLTPSTTYYFVLKVHDDAGNTAVSSLSTATNANPCEGFTCAPTSFACAPDGVSRIETSETCVDVDNTATCKESQTTTVCPGANGVCFKDVCDTAAAPGANQLSISEVMHSPSSGVTEYIELTNNTGNLLNLNGLSVLYRNSASVTSSTTVSSGSSKPLIVDRKGTFVLAQNKDSATNGGVSADYQYGTDLNLEGSGRLVLNQGATTVEDFQYTPSFPQTLGRSMNLSALVVGTKASAYTWYWCDSEAPLKAGGDLGTPNARNSTCGMPDVPTLDWCNIQYPKTFPEGTDYPATVSRGSSWSIYSQFYGASITDRNTKGNDFYPHVAAELGYGTDPANPAGWTWTAALPNGGYASAFSNNDEVLGSLRINTLGTYKYGFRYRLWNTATGSYGPYVYCDQSGVTTPPAGNYGTVTVSAPVLTSYVVISEFASKNLKSDGTVNHDDEFIELHNPTNSPISLTGWKIEYKSTSSAFSALAGLTLSGSIPARGYYLVAQRTSFTGSVTPDATYTALTSHNGGSLRLVNGSGTVVDRLAWGTATTAGLDPEGSPAPLIDNAIAGSSLERKAYTTSTAATMAVGGVDADRGNGTDSNNNANDFVVRTARQPQNASSAAEYP